MSGNYLIDTNIFLEVLLNQKGADECERLLINIKDSKKSFYISSFTLHSIEVIMSRNKLLSELKDFLYFIEKSKIVRVDTTISDEVEAIGLIQKFDLDFDDSIQLSLCKRYNLEIVSYDKHFDKTFAGRVEPKDVVFV